LVSTVVGSGAMAETFNKDTPLTLLGVSNFGRQPRDISGRAASASVELTPSLRQWNGRFLQFRCGFE